MAQPHAFQITVTRTYNLVLETDTVEYAREIANEVDTATLDAACDGRVSDIDHRLRYADVNGGKYTVVQLDKDNGTLTKSLCGEDETIPGVLLGMDTDEGIARCDDCRWYDGDLEAAAVVAARVGGVVRWSGDDDRDHTGTDVPDGVMIADGTNPWVEVNGQPVSWRAAVTFTA